jgi:hypothetical protein
MKFTTGGIGVHELTEYYADRQTGLSWDPHLVDVTERSMGDPTCHRCSVTYRPCAYYDESGNHGRIAPYCDGWALPLKHKLLIREESHHAASI